MKGFLIVIFTLFIISCSESNKSDGTYEKIMETYNDGKPKVVSTFEDSLESYQRTFFPSAKLWMEGSIVEGKRSGKWTSYYENGVTNSIMYFDRGMKTGDVKCFFPNKQLKYTGQFERNQKSGEWKFYDEDGSVIRTEKY